MNGTVPRTVAIQTFSTAVIPLRRRLSFWNDLSRNTYTPVTADPLHGCSFEATLNRAVLGEIRIGQVSGTPAIVYHTRQHAARTRRRWLFLQLQLEGESAYQQDGRDARLAPGDFTLLDNTRSYTSRFGSRQEILVLGFPEHIMRQVLGQPEAVTCLAMKRTQGINDMLGRYIMALWSTCLNGVPTSTVPHVTDALLELLRGAFAVLPEARATMTDARTTRYLRAIQFIETRLRDASLTPTHVASACNISLRHLHRLFAERDETVGEIILRRRLEECALLLQSPLHRRRTLSSIATDHGFQSLTSFGKAFRDRYGMTPSEYRQRQPNASR